MRAVEALYLPWLNVWVRLKKLTELARVALRYYGNLAFLKADFALWRLYLLKNPYAVSKAYLVSRGVDDVYTYGETPLTTLHKLARAAEIHPSDVVYELGCGTGRTLLWLRLVLGCSAIGVEQIPTFIVKGRSVVRRQGISNVEIIEDDLLNIDYSQATVVYLYGLSFDDPFIDKLREKLQALPKGARIISVSYPLEGFEIIKTVKGRYTWGTAEVFIQVRT